MPPEAAHPCTSAQNLYRRIMMAFDHLVVATTDLAAGTAALEAQLGLPLAPGGAHAAMGTHNRLLSLGPDCYLELIAMNPAAPGPDQPRWYALDAFDGPTRLTNWAVRCDDLDAGLKTAPQGTGTAWDLARGTLRWRMAVPPTGQTPFDGLAPALLEWQCPHPAPNLPDHGLRLQKLTLESPEATALRGALPDLNRDGVEVTDAVSPRLRAELSGPSGTVQL